MSKLIAGARRRLSILYWRVKSNIERFLRAYAYAVRQLSADQAQSIICDCETTAGWHALLTLCAEDVLDQARERFFDHAALPLLVSEACSQVARKWEDHGDALHYAQSWAMELVEAWATSMDVDLVVRTPSLAADDDAERLL